MERPALLDSVLKAFKQWHAEQVEGHTKPSKHLPIFWIEGQPGDGKSVLLLQLMAACLREQLATTISWLEHSSDGRAFRAEPPLNSRWGFCAEVPTRADGVTRDSWLAMLLAAGATMLVTSGSSEIRHGFEFRYETRAKVTKFVLPPFNSTEAVLFAEWFSTRSEIFRDPATLWREGMSLTEFLFALHHGKPLADLTSDIRGALGNLGLGARVRAVWLVNALGLRAPATLLTSDVARNHAVKIAERGVVPVEIRASGLRLAPPGIGWPMVGTWLGKGNELQHLVDALANILKAWLDANDEENAIRFLRELWGTEWLVDVKSFGHGNPFIQLKRREVLRELYRVHRRDFGGQPAPATIPVWLELNETFALMLLPDTVGCATEIFTKPEQESRRTPLLAALIWLAADSRRAPIGSDARKAVTDYLSSESGVGVGSALMRLARDTKKLPEARAVAEAWLKKFPDHPEALAVIGVLVKRTGNTEEFLTWVAERFVQPSEARPGAAKLLAAMLEGKPHDESIRQRASAWAWSRVFEPETGIVWVTLMMEQLAKEDVLRGAARWLAANPTHPQADVLRTRLLKQYPKAFEAAWVMQEWMPKHFDDDETPKLLLRLFEHQSNNRKAGAQVLEWINHSPTHLTNPKLLRLLLKHPSHEVQAAAELWFDANPDSPAHAELLSAFIRTLRGVVQWNMRGENYITDARRPGREHVIGSLLMANHCQLTHVRLALPLLPELKDSARGFLETTLGRSLVLHPLQAEQVFQEFWETPQIPDLARAVARGLEQIIDLRVAFASRVFPAMDDQAAFLTLRHLIRADVRSPEIINVLLDWLRKHYRERNYTSLLGALTNHELVWRCLFVTGRLDQRIITDFKNYRAKPVESA